MNRLTAIAALLLAASCGGGPTEIVLVIDTDIPEVDGLRVDVTFPLGGTGSSEANLSTQPAPRRLVLVHDAGPLGPVMVRVRGMQVASEVVHVERALTFERGRTLTLEIFLSARCQALSCSADASCGDDGRCRPTQVQPCEFVGRSCQDGGLEDGGLPGDAAVPDGGVPDAGVTAACSEARVCGVSDRHLPGDLVEPFDCDAPTGGGTVTVTGPGGVLAPWGAGVYSLDQIGSYTVQVAPPSGACVKTRTIEVPMPIRIPDDFDISSDDLRDLDARVGAAFVAGRRGPYAVDTSGWYDLREGTITGDSMAPENQRAVAVVGDAVFFGPGQNEGAIHRINTAAPFSSSEHLRIELPPGNRQVRAMDARVGHLGPIAVATRSGVLLVNAPASGPSVDSRSSFEADRWVAVGALEHDTLGALWAGGDHDLINRHLSGGGDVLNDRDTVRGPDFLGDLAAAVVPDDVEAAPLLWLCGSDAVARFDFPDRDWKEESRLPTRTARWSGACYDMAATVDGDIWVAGRADGLFRLDAGADERAAVTTSTRLPAGFVVDFVAFASDATARQLWVLDAGAREMLVFEADTLP